MSTRRVEAVLAYRNRLQRLLVVLAVPLITAWGGQAPASLNEQLIAATGSGDVAAVTDVLANGADVNARDPLRGATALYVAAEKGHAEIVKVLLDHGADPNVKDLEFGRTALRNATMPGSSPDEKRALAEIIKLLVAHNAGTEGESLVDLIRGGFLEAARTIVRRGGVDPLYLNLAFGAAERLQDAELIELLTVAGAKSPGPQEGVGSPERVIKMTGVYQNASGQRVALMQAPQGDELLLDRPGGARVAFVALDLMMFRSLDGRQVLTRKAGPLPPTSLTLVDGLRSEVLSRVGDLPVETVTKAGAVKAPTPVASIRAPVARLSTPVGAWPEFHGPDSSGVADYTHPPTVWDVEKGINILWKTPIPGFAHSSPIVWENRVFVTTAVPKTEANLTFRYGNSAGSSGGSANFATRDDVPHTWRVYALDKSTGKIVWERVAHEGTPKTSRHVMGSQADPTPVTDGTHLVAFFGSEGLYCYDLNGKLLWSRDLGVLRSGYSVDPTYVWTIASSPVIYKNRVIVQVDLLKDSFIAAFDINTGKDVWRTKRDEVPSWATPVIYRGAKRTELVTVAPTYARGYDADTGRELWRFGRHSTFATPTPLAAGGSIVLTSGSGGTIQPIYVIREGATGDVTLKDGEDTSETVVWSAHRGGAYLSTPVIYGDLLYICADNGVLSAYKLDTGERVYQERLTRGGNYAASVVAADGYLYFANEDGDVVVVKAGPKFERVAVNKVGEVVMATPAISNGIFIVRGLHTVIAAANSR